jgi:hypothetical protein
MTISEPPLLVWDLLNYPGEQAHDSLGRSSLARSFETHS